MSPIKHCSDVCCTLCCNQYGGNCQLTYRLPRARRKRKWFPVKQTMSVTDEGYCEISAFRCSRMWTSFSRLRLVLVAILWLTVMFGTLVASVVTSNTSLPSISSTLNISTLPTTTVVHGQNVNNRRNVTRGHLIPARTKQTIMSLSTWHRYNDSQLLPLKVHRKMSYSTAPTVVVMTKQRINRSQLAVEKHEKAKDNKVSDKKITPKSRAVSSRNFGDAQSEATFSTFINLVPLTLKQRRNQQSATSTTVATTESPIASTANLIDVRYNSVQLIGINQRNNTANSNGDVLRKSPITRIVGDNNTNVLLKSDNGLIGSNSVNHSHHTNVINSDQCHPLLIANSINVSTVFPSDMCKWWNNVTLLSRHYQYYQQWHAPNVPSNQSFANVHQDKLSVETRPAHVSPLVDHNKVNSNMDNNYYLSRDNDPNTLLSRYPSLRLPPPPPEFADEFDEGMFGQLVFQDTPLIIKKRPTSLFPFAQENK